MSSNISQWLKTSEISPVLLNLNLTHLTPILDCEAAGRFAAEFYRLLKNDTTALPLTSLAIFLHSYSAIPLTNVTLASLGNGSPCITQSTQKMTDRPLTTLDCSLSTSRILVRKKSATISNGQVIRICLVLV